MGGLGSGRQKGLQGDRDTDHGALSVAQVRKQLEAAGQLAFRYQWGGETVTVLVAIDWTPCHFGGWRSWFVCPRCGRRAGKLYTGQLFACRRCHGFHYASQYDLKGAPFRNIYRLQTRLRRKGIHWRTRQALQARLFKALGQANRIVQQELGRVLHEDQIQG